MTITNISNLRKNLSSYFADVIEYDDTITVTTKKGNAVIISETEYNSILETIYSDSKKIKEGEQEDLSSMQTYNPNEKW